MTDENRLVDSRLAEAMGWTWRRAPLRRDRPLKMLVQGDEDFFSWTALQGDEIQAADCFRFVPPYSTDVRVFQQFVEQAIHDRGLGARYVNELADSVRTERPPYFEDFDVDEVWALMRAPLDLKARAALSVLEGKTWHQQEIHNMQTIRNEQELPGSGSRSDYIRSKCDPTVLVASKTGDCFTRRDGAKWEWPGYKVTLDFHGKAECEPATGLEDTVRFRPDGRAEEVAHILPKQKQAVA